MHTVTNRRAALAAIPRSLAWAFLAIVPAMFAAVVFGASARPALAQENRASSLIKVAAAENFELGQSGLIVATLTDGAGKPIVGASIKFVTPAEFAGAVAEVDLGEAVTGENGRAQLVHRFRTEGKAQFVARYFGDDRFQPAQSSVIVTVAGTAQLYQPKAGLRIPVLGSWVLAAILLGVWSVYFTSLVVVWRMSREAPGEQAGEA